LSVPGEGAIDKFLALKTMLLIAWMAESF
jgi:hypothetical protein